MSAAATNDPTAIALRALAATLCEQRLAERFLSLSGIEPPELRQRASDPEVLVALLRFLEANEMDLITIASAISAKPEQLVAARQQLER